MMYKEVHEGQVLDVDALLHPMIYDTDNRYLWKLINLDQDWSI